MNIIICVKQVPDTEASLIVKDGMAINEANIKWIISPYDEYAIEEGLKLKKALDNASVTALTLGPNRCENALRTALAMGADAAYHIESEATMDHLTLSRCLAAGIREIGLPAVVLMGKQAIDDDAFLTHVYLAEQLGVPVSTNLTNLGVSNGEITADREIDEGAKEQLAFSIPCVLGVGKGAYTPKLPNLMGVMKAKKVVIPKKSPTDLGLSDLTPAVVPTKLFAPPEKPQGRIIPGEPEDAVKELVRLLKEEAKVL
jgi:electron transfer flavoprotein beta subunit